MMILTEKTVAINMVEIADIRANLCPNVSITTRHISGKASCGNQRQVVVAQELRQPFSAG